MFESSVLITSNEKEVLMEYLYLLRCFYERSKRKVKNFKTSLALPLPENG